MAESNLDKTVISVCENTLQTKKWTFEAVVSTIAGHDLLKVLKVG